MQNTVFITDSACDLKPEFLSNLGFKVINLNYAFEKPEIEKDLTIKQFYDYMRGGQVAKTTAINPDTFLNVFREELKNGNDVFYIAFSSGLSTTYNSANIAKSELAEEFPERKIIIVDSLAASAGQGLFVYLVANRIKECETIEELESYAENLKLNICHWFTVDDLVYLKRGGRVSPAVAFVGGVLGIKPILHVDNEGHLINVSKRRGRKAAISALAEKFEETAKDIKNGTVFISHGDCIEDAQTLAKIIKSKHNVEVKLITDIGPVIGAHSGPGTLALFFVGNER